MDELWTNDVARGLLIAGMSAALSIPMAGLGFLLRKLPEAIIGSEPNKIPAILAATNLVAAFLLGTYVPWIPLDVAIVVGVGSGWAAGTASSHLKPKE